MMFTDFAPAKECMRFALRDFQRSLELDKLPPQKYGKSRSEAFSHGMDMLVGTQTGLDGDDAPTPTELADFRIQIGALVAANNNGFYIYLCGCLDHAIRSRVDGWWDPSFERSAIQLLLDDYPPTAELLADKDNRDMLEEADEVLHERAPDIAPLPEDTIPHGLPDSHWWWRLPSGDPPDEIDEWVMNLA